MSKYTLTKRIPARTKTITARWCKRDFAKMCQQWRDIRSKCRSKMDQCYWCHHAFEDGDMMALASFDGSGNKVLCQKCADELMGPAEAAKGDADAQT